jgi:hypothetical protein
MKRRLIERKRREMNRRVFSENNKLSGIGSRARVRMQQVGERTSIYTHGCSAKDAGLNDGLVLTPLVSVGVFKGGGGFRVLALWGSTMALSLSQG